MEGGDEFGTRRNEKADGTATVMAIGKANPQHCVDQSTYPDYYFGITNNQHMTELKNKFKRICERSTIKRRYMHLTEDIHKAPSFDARQDIVTVELPNLAKRAAEKAIHEWGQSKSKITHLVFCTTSTGDMPGADYHLATILGLQSAVNRYMMYQQGCSGGGTVLRLAKDLAENNKGARVLAVCCEILAHSFHGPGEKNSENLVSMALFSDGAAAVIVGADPVIGVEKPLFEVICAAQTIVPDSKEIIQGRLRGDGLTINLKKDVSMFISENMGKCLKGTFGRLGVSDWNALFWVVHPGGPAILNKIQDTLNLEPQKLQASRQVLSEYGNMWSASVLFVMDEMRNRSVEQGLRTTGEGMEWGVLFGFGPGLSVETLVLRSVLNRDS